MLLGALCYFLWGLFPAYFPLLEPAGAVEIIAHRITWTAVLMGIVCVAAGAHRELRALRASQWGVLAVAGILVASNWLIYVFAVNSGHVAEAALGYFINPLVNVAFGMAIFGERLQPLKKVAVGIATVAVVFITVAEGSFPFLGVGVAVTFALYGAVKKKVTISSVASVTAETAVLAPFAIAFLVYMEATGSGTFTGNGPGHAALLSTTGIVTGVPLLLFGTAVQRVSLSTMGMLQFISPTMQFFWALLVTHEEFSTARWVGFVIIWVAIGMYLVSDARTARTRRSRLVDDQVNPT
ncbi:EamA family transporter RarD [Corynebacterium glucuronolyticum]|uniref:EamA family transporter RarD n=1 Tax=Corynebacterium glucuronolyticum TaxID=39791 RepID=UPI00191FF0ED|nr:EamA family transporter RarD [Corynebacterium glucuronolyticum]QQU89289.1 EamA family transporter RarD [Corynebacterium glucuronolyticum]